MEIFIRSIEYWNLISNHSDGHHQYTNIPDKDQDLDHFYMKDKPITGLIKNKLLKMVLFGNLFYISIMNQFNFFRYIFTISSRRFLKHKKTLTVDINEEFIEFIKNDRLIFQLLQIQFFIGCYPHGILKGFFALFWSWNIHGLLI